MVNTDEDALICDLAEVYRIYDMRELPPLKVAVFSCGLRENSRIKMKLSGSELDINTLLLAVCADSLQFLAWCKTENARRNVCKPTSLLEIITKGEKKSDVVGFDDAEAFKEHRQAIIERIKHVNNSNSLCTGSSINKGNKE